MYKGALFNIEASGNVRLMFSQKPIYYKIFLALRTSVIMFRQSIAPR